MPEVPKARVKVKVPLRHKKGMVALFFDDTVVTGHVTFNAQKVQENAVFTITMVKKIPRKHVRD